MQHYGNSSHCLYRPKSAIRIETVVSAQVARQPALMYGCVIPMPRLLVAPTLIFLLLAVGFLIEFWPVVVALVALAVGYIGIGLIPSCLSMKLSKAAETQRMSHRGFQSLCHIRVRTVQLPPTSL